MFGRKIRSGLDLGSFALKIATREARSNHCYVWSDQLYPERTEKDQEFDAQFTGGRLRELVARARQELPAFNRNVVASVLGDGVFYGFFELPALSAKELQVAIPSALTREVPLSLDELDVSSVQVPSLSGAKKTGIFYCAVRKSRVEKTRRLLEHCDLALEKVKPTPMALAAEFCVNRHPDPNSVVALVNVGYRYTLVMILKGGFPYFARDIELAGAHFTYAFQMASQISWERAEEFKLDYQITEKDFMIEPFLLDWTSQIKKSFEYFSRTTDAPEPSEIFLSGGSAQWAGLARRLQTATGIKVTQDGWAGMTKVEGGGDEQESSSLHKVSIGLSLSSAEVKAWQVG